MIEINDLDLTRKEKLHNLTEEVGQVLQRCEVPDEFIGWLVVTVKERQISEFDAIKLALKIGPDAMQFFPVNDWE